MFELIKAGSYTFEQEVWSCVSSEAQDLVKGLLTVKPSRRYNRDQILGHPWLNGKFKASKKLLPM